MYPWNITIDNKLKRKDNNGQNITIFYWSVFWLWTNDWRTKLEE